MTQINRRQCLRGFGFSLALPWLPSLVAAKSRDADKKLKRSVFIYTPNGMHMPNWRPAAPETPEYVSGDSHDLGQLPASLQPLEPFRSSLSVLSGLTLDKARANGDGPGDHARAAGAYLTCTQPYKGRDSQAKVAISADQIIARAIGQETRFASLQLGGEPGPQAGQCDSGYPCVYSNNIAWASPFLPLVHETSPAMVFDRLFGAGLGHLDPEERKRRVSQKRSILDWVRKDARRLAGQASVRDRRKLEEYLNALRELELRIQNASEPNPEMAGKRPTEKVASFEARIQLMFELMALALESDSTRVITFMLANEGSGRSYRNLEVKSGHHSLSHHGGDQQKLASIAKINLFHVTLCSAFLQRLSSTEGESAPLLDSTLVSYGSGIADGNRHAHHDLPQILVGGGLLPGNRHLVFPKATPLGNLYRSMFSLHGIDVPRFGDSTRELQLPS